MENKPNNTHITLTLKELMLEGYEEVGGTCPTSRK
jgi:hypothetical protein